MGKDMVWSLLCTLFDQLVVLHTAHRHIERETDSDAGLGELRFDESVYEALTKYKGKRCCNGYGGVMDYYRPSVDMFLISFTGKTSAQLIQAHKLAMVSKARTRMDNSVAETLRRGLRSKILEAAEKQWDQSPSIPDDGLLGFGDASNPPLQSVQELFQQLRTTFAPTSRLKGFLFPPWFLSDKLTSCLSISDFKWLKDPTATLNRFNLTKRLLDEAWVTNAAQRMLEALADYRSPNYDTIHGGGTVTTWIKAASDWNMSRIEAELADGSTIRLEHMTATTSHDLDRYKHRGIRRMREQLGLPRSPTLQEFSSQNALVGKEAAANRFFHKIVRHACTRCPESSFYFFPCGLESMLTHMREQHPVRFWTGSFHSLT